MLTAHCSMSVRVTEGEGDGQGSGAESVSLWFRFRPGGGGEAPANERRASFLFPIHACLFNLQHFSSAPACSHQHGNHPKLHLLPPSCTPPCRILKFGRTTYRAGMQLVLKQIRRLQYHYWLLMATKGRKCQEPFVSTAWRQISACPPMCQTPM